MMALKIHQNSICDAADVPSMSCTRIIKACCHVYTCRSLILGLFRLLKVNPTFAEYKQGFKQGFEQDNVGVQQHYPVSEIIYHHPSMSSTNTSN